MSASVQKKVRDVKFCRETARVATVSADGTLMVLDAQLSLIRTVSGGAAPGARSSHHHEAQLLHALLRLEVHAGLVAVGHLQVRGLLLYMTVELWSLRCIASCGCHSRCQSSRKGHR